MNSATIVPILKSQFEAALEMLRRAVEQCPGELWEHAPLGLSAFWRVAHHTVWFADFYLSADEESFAPWPKHVDDHQHLGPYRSWESDEPPRIGTPTTQAAILEFIDHVRGRLDAGLQAVPLDGPSGFSWLTFSRMESIIYNTRHIQHHAAQLIARLREHAGVEVEWVGKWPLPSQH